MLEEKEGTLIDVVRSTVRTVDTVYTPDSSDSDRFFSKFIAESIKESLRIETQGTVVHFCCSFRDLWNSARRNRATWSYSLTSLYNWCLLGRFVTNSGFL